MALFSKGIMLTQYKEPALSNKIVNYTSPQPQFFSLKKEMPQDYRELSSRDIITIAKAAQIYDERDGKLLVSKLRRIEKKASAIIVDAIDDEPYVSSKMVLLLQMEKLVLLGIELCRIVAETNNISIQTYRNLGDIHSPIPSRIGIYKVERISGGYPALPSTKYSSNTLGSEQLIVGPGALVHLARAVLDHIPQSTTFITVAGNCIANPMNLEVSLGMTVAEIIERCGLRETPGRIVRGGPMTGFAVIDINKTLITPTTRAVLALKEVRFLRQYSCINCGRCEEFCPRGLNPRYIAMMVKRKVYSDLELFDPQECIMCGTCSYVCPSRLNVAGDMFRAKQQISKFDPTGMMVDSEGDDSEV